MFRRRNGNNIKRGGLNEHDKTITLYGCFFMYRQRCKGRLYVVFHKRPYFRQFVFFGKYCILVGADLLQSGKGRIKWLLEELTKLEVLNL